MKQKSNINIDNAFALSAGLLISVISAWYSIVGLTAIFTGAFWSIIVMGVTLEFGKIITASYLYRNWKMMPLTMITYFSSAVVVLMLITSMGTFGYLSKAHIEQTASLTDIEAKIERLDSSLSRERIRITRADAAIKQLDNAIDVMIANDRATRGLQHRRDQEKERTQIQEEILVAQGVIDKLLDQRMPLSQQFRLHEREVGPIRYVAQLIYGKSDKEITEKAVRVIIILLVLVLDPLAVLLIMITTKRKEADEFSKQKYDYEAKKWLQKNANAVATDGKEWKDIGVIVTKKK